MRSKSPAGDTVTVRLQEAIDRLQEDVRRVEIWAGALSGFLEPVPGYDAEDQRHMLPSAERRGPARGQAGDGAFPKRSFPAPLKRA